MQTPMADPKRSLFAAAIACAVGVGLLLVACEQDQAPTEAPPIEPPSIISDGARGGNPDFFFLPPLVPNPVNHPDFDNPDEADEFNGDLIPVVEICQLDGDPSTQSPVDCESGMGPVKRFAPDEAQQVEVMYDEEHYLALWHTDESNLNADAYYRIQVFVGGVRLGFADVDVVNSGRELKNVNTGEFVPLRDDRTLPIKFRIEQGALCDPGATLCSERTLDASQGGAVILMDPAAHEPGDWDRFDVPWQPGGVFEVLDAEGDPDTTSFVTFSMEYCEGFLDEAVGGCLKIESKPQILRFAEPATVSFCEVEEQDPTTLLTIYQKHDGRVIPIPHADDKCSLNIGRSESTGLMRFVDAGWRLVKRPLARVFVPQPLVASAPVVMHRGKGALLDGSTSLFEIGAPPDKFSGLISWWTGDGHFRDIYGGEVESDRNDGAPATDFSEPLDTGVVHFAAGIIDSAFDFSSSEDFVRVTSGYGITDRPLTELTLAAWVKLNSLAAPDQIQRFVTIAPPGTETAMLRNQRGEQGPDELHFAMKFDLEEISGNDGCDEYGFCHINVSNVLTAGSCFHHVAGTYGPDGYMRLYLDSVEVGSLDVGATPVSEGDQGFAISSPDEPLDGLIDDVVVYNVALTASQIAEIRGEDATGKCEPPVPEVGFTLSSQSAVEAGGPIIATARLSFASAIDVSVPFTVQGSATALEDYTITPSPLVIAAGDTSADVIVSVVDDAIDEADETVVVIMGTPTNATLGTDTEHTVTIQDDDPPPLVSINASPSAIPEDGSVTADVTAILSTVSALNVTVALAFTGTAEQGTDYAAASSIVIPAGYISVMIALTAVDDVDIEADETVIIDVTSVTNGIEEGVQQAVVTIIDDDVDPLSLYGWGTSNVDGEISGYEWGGAGCYEFYAAVPEGGTIPAELCVMNDDTHFYGRVRYARAVDPRSSVDLNFEVNSQVASEDMFGLDRYYSTAPFRDETRFDNSHDQSCPVGSSCTNTDVNRGGTSDGQGAYGNDGTESVIEISHPLASGDIYDFNLNLGQAIDFWLGVNLFNAAGAYERTYKPGGGSRFHFTVSDNDSRADVTVLDPSGDPILDTVVLMTLPSGLQWEGNTYDTGTAAFTGLYPGTYTVEAYTADYGTLEGTILITGPSQVKTLVLQASQE